MRTNPFSGWSPTTRNGHWRAPHWLHVTLPSSGSSPGPARGLRGWWAIARSWGARARSTEARDSAQDVRGDVDRDALAGAAAGRAAGRWDIRIVAPQGHLDVVLAGQQVVRRVETTPAVGRREGFYPG